VQAKAESEPRADSRTDARADGRTDGRTDGRLEGRTTALTRPTHALPAPTSPEPPKKPSGGKPTLRRIK
jgi:hypothetical protein